MKKNTFYGIATLTLGFIAAGDADLLLTAVLLIPMAYCFKRFIETMEE